MNKEIKTKWTAKLRSGLYPQGTGWLNSNQRLCCMGVLCELAIEEGVELEKEPWLDNGGAEDHINYDNSSGDCPGKVLDWADLKEEESDTLINMNDGMESKGIRKHSFEEIADYIEKNL